MIQQKNAVARIEIMGHDPGGTDLGHMALQLPDQAGIDDKRGVGN